VYLLRNLCVKFLSIYKLNRNIRNTFSSFQPRLRLYRFNNIKYNIRKSSVNVDNCIVFYKSPYSPDFRTDKILNITNITELQYQRNSIFHSTVNFIRVILSNFYS